MRQFIVKHKLAFLFIFALLIRLIHLDQSLWLDEATTAIAVQTHSIWSIVTQFSPADFHPPLYYLFMDVWTNIFGYSEVALRMPSVLFSLGAGYFVYKTLRVMTNDQCPMSNDQCAFWSAAFFLLNPLIVYYSQEARMYSMVTFFIAASFYYLVKFMKHDSYNMQHKKHRKDLLWMNVFLILSFYTFYASAFYIAAVYLYILFASFKKGIPRSAPAFLGMTRVFSFSIFVFILAIGIISPLLLTQLANSKIALQTVTNWSMVLGNVSLKNLSLIPLKFTSGRISFEPKMLYYLLAGGWMAVVFGVSVIGVWDSSRRLKDLHARDSSTSLGMTLELLYFILFPLLLGVIFSFNSPLLQYFRFQYLIVFVSILLGVSIASIGRSLRIDIVLPASMSLIFLFWSLTYLLVPQFHREDWKSLAGLLEQENNPVYMIPSSSDPLKYYAPEIRVRPLQELSEASLPQRILVIPYTADIHGVEYRQILDSSRVNTRSQSFREVGYEVWDLK